MLRLTKRELFLLVSYVAIVFAIGLYFSLFKLFYVKNQEIKSQTVAVAEALAKIDSILKDKQAVEEEYRVFEQKLVNKELQETITTEILQDIKSKAAQAGLNVVNIKPFALKEEGGYAEFPIKLETEGDLENLGKFLYNLDETAYIFAIKNLQMNAQTQSAPIKIQLLLTAILAKG